MASEYLITPEKERENKRRSAIITALILGAILLLALLMAFKPAEPDFPPEGILVQFGTDQTGFGPTEPSQSAPATSASNPTESVTQPAETFSDPNTVPVSTNPRPTTNNSPNPNPTTTTQPDPFKPKHTFPGSTGSGSGNSQGNTQGSGNMGDPLGGDDGAYQGSNTGTGIQGTGRGVGGRGWAVKPNLSQFHQVQEVLKVDILARKDGTIYDVKVVGGTLTDPTLIRQIIAQIKRGRLTADPSAPDIEQLATWTIRFALN